MKPTNFKFQLICFLRVQTPCSTKKIIEAGLAPNYCPGYGFDYTTRQGTMTIGVQGISDKDTRKILGEIKNILKEAAETGFEKNLFETVLHQIELNAKRTKEHRGLGYLSHMVP